MPPPKPRRGPRKPSGPSGLAPGVGAADSAQKADLSEESMDYIPHKLKEILKEFKAGKPQ